MAQVRHVADQRTVFVRQTTEEEKEARVSVHEIYCVVVVLNKI